MSYSDTEGAESVKRVITECEMVDDFEMAMEGSPKDNASCERGYSQLGLTT